MYCQSQPAVCFCWFKLCHFHEQHHALSVELPVRLSTFLALRQAFDIKSGCMLWYVYISCQLQASSLFGDMFVQVT